jgi:uncharacterized protein YkwD
MKMKYCLLLIYLVFSSLNNFSQTNYLETFSAEEISKANTAKEVENYSEEEKNTILYINLARMYPQKYANVVAKKYIAENEIKSSVYTKSLLNTLQNIKALHPLQAHEALDKFAIQHATESGKKGKFGHDGFENRAKELSKTFVTVAENCDYGSAKGIDIAFSLLIDEGVKDYGHRKNLLNPEYFYIGISIKPHKTFEVNCVQLLGGKLR